MAGKLSTRKERAMELKLIRLQLRQIEERIVRFVGSYTMGAAVNERLTGSREGLVNALRLLDGIDADKDV